MIDSVWGPARPGEFKKFEDVPAGQLWRAAYTEMPPRIEELVVLAHEVATFGSITVRYAVLGASAAYHFSRWGKVMGVVVHSCAHDVDLGAEPISSSLQMPHNPQWNVEFPSGLVVQSRVWSGEWQEGGRVDHEATPDQLSVTFSSGLRLPSYRGKRRMVAEHPLTTITLRPRLVADEWIGVVAKDTHHYPNENVVVYHECTAMMRELAS